MMGNVELYVVMGPTDYEEYGVCGVFFDPTDAARACERAPRFYDVDSVPEQYTVHEIRSSELLEEGALAEVG